MKINYVLVFINIVFASIVVFSGVQALRGDVPMLARIAAKCNAWAAEADRPSTPSVINWVDVAVKDPDSGRPMILQVGLRADGVVSWRAKP